MVQASEAKHFTNLIPKKKKKKSCILFQNTLIISETNWTPHNISAIVRSLSPFIDTKPYAQYNSVLHEYRHFLHYFFTL